MNDTNWFCRLAARLFLWIAVLAFLPFAAAAQEGELTEAQSDEIRNEVESRLSSALNELWFNRVRFSADVRARYHGEYFGDENEDYRDPADPHGLPLNNEVDRHRFRTRARVGFVLDLGTGFETAFRLVTGGTDPTSLNQTMGTYFQKYAVGLDTAYGRWIPPFFPLVSLTAGRFANPFWSTEMVWHSSLSMDGAALQGRVPLRFDGFLAPDLSFQIEPAIAGGFFPLEELDFEPEDKYLMGGQVNVKLGISQLVFAKPEVQGPELRLGVGYYTYLNTQGKLSPIDEPERYYYTAPAFEQKGNTRFDIDPDVTSVKYALASKFTILDFMGELRYQMEAPLPIHAILTGNFATNIGYNEDEVNERTGRNVEPATNAYFARLELGHGVLRRLGTFTIFGTYRYVERDAVMDAYTDSDFRGGGTDAQGFTVGASAFVAPRVTVSVSFMSAREIDPDPKTSVGDGTWAQNSLLVDVNLAF